MSMENLYINGIENNKTIRVLNVLTETLSKSVPMREVRIRAQLNK